MRTNEPGANEPTELEVVSVSEECSREHAEKQNCNAVMYIGNSAETKLLQRQSSTESEMCNDSEDFSSNVYVKRRKIETDVETDLLRELPNKTNGQTTNGNAIKAELLPEYKNQETCAEGELLPLLPNTVQEFKGKIQYCLELQDKIQEEKIINKNILKTKQLPETGNKSKLKSKRNESVLKTEEIKEKQRNKKVNKKKSKQTENENELTIYLRKKFLQTFLNEGCTPQRIEEWARLYNVKLEDIHKHFSPQVEDAQHYVKEECDSLSFNNITEWLKYFKSIGAADHSNYEAAIIMNAITHNESHPEPESVGGINLKAIYKFLSNALMGLPQKPLDQMSANYLSKEFQNLISLANTNQADEDVRNLKIKIEATLGNTTTLEPSSLDSLNISDNIQLHQVPDYAEAI